MTKSSKPKRVSSPKGGINKKKRIEGNDISQGVMEKNIIAPYVDPITGRTAASMNSQLWKYWEMAGKWYSILCTIAAHWVLTRNGKKCSKLDVKYEHKADKANFMKTVEQHKLFKLENKLYEQGDKGRKKYSKHYATKVWHFIQLHFTEGADDKKKWIYTNVNTKDTNPDLINKQLSYFQSDISYKFIWPKPTVLRNRGKVQQDTIALPGVVERGWHLKLVQMEKDRSKYIRFYVLCITVNIIDSYLDLSIKLSIRGNQ